MKKIVINKCFGGFGLSPKGLKRFAELNGKECYFFKWDITPNTYTPLSIEEAEEQSLFFITFSVPNPQDYLKTDGRDKDGTFETRNKEYEEILIGNDIKRDDPTLIQVVEELGTKANGGCANLKIVPIPNDVDWEIDEYDGLETIHEIHRTWG